MNQKEIQEQYLWNEDNNLHTLNITLLCKHFGSAKEFALMKAICEYQEYVGYANGTFADVKQELHNKYYSQLFPQVTTN
tara:strand:- start:55 stop:291 length:237 start_codon:yes stop_codon:yes gene_type:complete